MASSCYNLLLSDARKAAGLSRAQLALQCGVSREAVRLVELGSTVPSTPLLRKWAEVVGIEYDSLSLVVTSHRASKIGVELPSRGDSDALVAKIERVLLTSKLVDKNMVYGLAHSIYDEIKDEL